LRPLRHQHQHQHQPKWLLLLHLLRLLLPRLPLLLLLRLLPLPLKRLPLLWTQPRLLQMLLPPPLPLLPLPPSKHCLPTARTDLSRSVFFRLYLSASATVSGVWRLGLGGAKVPWRVLTASLAGRVLVVRMQLTQQGQNFLLHF
jgi:hypothetical protein